MKPFRLPRLTVWLGSWRSTTRGTHGSWLNMAEIERSVLSRQCLSRRLGSFAEAERQVQAWETYRNQDQAKVDWRFTTPDARIKLKRLYPSQED